MLTVMHGIIRHTTNQEVRRTDGARRVLREYATGSRLYVSPLPSGTERIRFIKETFFGLSGPQGNHGEDVKEYFYYLDNLPTHSYMKMLYKYPQDEYPYKQLVDENRKRDRKSREFELIDTGIFADDRYFDIFIEYAKNGPEDILIKITADNRGSKSAELHIIPQLWFRNTWAWGYDDYKPTLTETGSHVIEADHKKLGRYFLYSENGELLFCDNETNKERLYGAANQSKVKDGINDFVVNGEDRGIAPEKEGTKAGIVYKTKIAGKSKKILRLRLTAHKQKDFLSDFESIFLERQKGS